MATAAAPWSTAVSEPAATGAQVYCWWTPLGVHVQSGDVAVVRLRPHWKKTKRVVMHGLEMKA